MKSQENISTARLRIAFAHIPGEGWSAGTYYLKNLFCALKSLSDDSRPERLLLVPEQATEKGYGELIPFVDEVLYRPAHNRSLRFVDLLSGVGEKLGIVAGKEHQVSSFLQRHRVDAFFTLGPPPSGFALPFLSWIPDFQHLHYPDFFSEQELVSRDSLYRRTARDATRVVLSSRDARRDFSGFAPEAVAKARVLSFVAQVPEEIFQREPAEICTKYHLPQRFILLPNQFWMHKNHATVIRALQTALVVNPEITIVCTGNTNENRNAAYFSKLLCTVSEAGVRDKMIILGLVPRLDLFYLMRQSLAVLQPSLFEGWNTTVEEVKSLGKSLIVSDLPVHREQNAPGAIYFPAEDAAALAMILQNVYGVNVPGPDRELEEQARASVRLRTKQYGETFMTIVRDAIGAGS